MIDNIKDRDIRTLIGMAEYVDAHTHLDMYNEDGDKERAMTEMRVRSILSLSNSMDIQSYEKTLMLYKDIKLAVPCFGIHPWGVKNNSYDWQAVEGYVADTPMVGEIGLDFYWVEDKSTFSAQKDVFEHLIMLAGKYKKPVNIHTKGAEREVLDIIRCAGGIKKVVHWYSGPEELVQEFLMLGCFFTVSVDILCSSYTKHLCSELPLSRILVETDNPEGYPWLYGRKGFPADVVQVYDAAAHIKSMPEALLKERIKENLMKVFSN